MKLFRRLLSLVLSSVLILGVSIQCFAAENTVYVFGGQEKEVIRRTVFCDPDGNGVCDASDARIILRVAAQLQTLPPDCEGADPDRDGIVTASDARMILRAAAKIDEYYEFADGSTPSGFAYNGDGKLVLFAEDGSLFSGLYETSDSRRYFGADHTAYEGLTIIDGVQYYMRADGLRYTGFAMTTELFHFRDGKAEEGFFDDESGRYYTDAYGHIIYGYKQIGDDLYCFDSETGAMLVNTTKDGYIIGADSICRKVIQGGEVTTSKYGAFKTTLIPFPEDETMWKLICLNTDYRVTRDVEDKIELSYVAGSSQRMDSRAAVWYNKMYSAAKADGIYLTPCSGYRSYSTQLYLYNEFVDEYIGYGYSGYEAEILASRRRMPAGSSEHNIGICMDIITASSADHFENYKAYGWLSEHAADYGFILRYPADKTEITGVKIEPWHWRYVGVENAAAIKASGLCLEEYLGLTG